MIEFALSAGAAAASYARAFGGGGRPSSIKDEVTDLERAGRQTFNNLTLNIVRSINDWKDALASFKDFFFQTFAQLAAQKLLTSGILALFGGATGGVGGFLASLVASNDTLGPTPQLAGAGGLTASFDFSRFPTSPNPLIAARDEQWQDFLALSVANGRRNGRRY